MIGRARVYGPAYLDRVVRVDRRLLASDAAPPLDRSVDGRLEQPLSDSNGWVPRVRPRTRATQRGGRYAQRESVPKPGEGEGLTLMDPSGGAIDIDPPAGWPGPFGVIDLDHEIFDSSRAIRRVEALGWLDDLGGMGAGFASALGGTLVSALSSETDPMSRLIASMLDKHGIEREGPRVDARPADWTLLVTSGGHGDKLAVGFRGCHAALEPGALAPFLADPCDCRVVAGLPNRLAAEVLRAPGARLRVFAPAMRNMIEREPSVLEMAAHVDILCCNRLEWESLENREEVAARISILVVTDGPSGSFARYTEPWGECRRIRVPAFPRARPPRDTNRAGEAFASWLIATLAGLDWDPSSGVVDDEAMKTAMTRASAAAGLVLDREEFGFPAEDEIDEAIRRGIVA